jgi:beta-glucanase (GH16 family)
VHLLRRGVVTGLVVLGVLASAAVAARSLDFRDDFQTLDTRRWVEITRPFGHGAVDAANVDTAGGVLRIRLPGGRLDGGELRTTSLFKYGSYRVRMKVANAPSSLTAFFLYRQPDYAQEIDIEIFNDSTGRIMFTTYSGGAMTNTVTKLLPFDPTAAFHDYVIEYDRGSVRFLADGVQMQAWSKGVTRNTMYLFVNAWFPSWLAGESPATDRYTEVDWVEHVSR